jgi:copper chaperone
MPGDGAMLASSPHPPLCEGIVMLELRIPQMTCSHCVKAVTEAVKTVDPAARVQVDLATHQVKVDTVAPREAVVARLADAGYAPA